MVRHIGKKGSKRMSCHKRFKILRKVREHNRKARREVRKTNKLNKGKRKKTKPINVPRECPFKDDLLGEAALFKQGLAEEREITKQQRKQDREKRAAEKSKDTDSAEKKTVLPPEDAIEVETDDESPAEDHSIVRFAAALRACSRDLKNVVAESDILLEVLDARDPLGTRNRELERRVLQSGTSKRIVLVLNKIDLIPVPVARKWLAYLRQELPTVALRANAEAQLKKLGSSNKFKALGGAAQKGLDRNSTRQSVGSEALMQLIRNYARIKPTLVATENTEAAEQTDQPTAVESAAKLAKPVTVGVIGYPSVGKRSVISCLRRERTNPIGVKPTVSVSRSLRALQLDRNLRLLESPGIVLDSSPRVNADMALRNALETDFVHDTARLAQAVVTKLGVPKLLEHYRVTSSQPDGVVPQNAHEFLNALARRNGQLKKGGVPDLNAAACRVVEDWQAGAVSFYVTPSTRDAPADEKVAEFARELDAETVYSSSDRDLFGHNRKQKVSDAEMKEAA